MNRNEMIQDFSRSIIQGNAGIFLGAGLSVSATYKDWKNLLKEPAKEIGLDIEKEQYDLISLAELIKNERNRAYINELIINEFERHDVKPTQNHNILASMPIDVYWTTNYDNLMEQALEKAKKSIAIKRKKADLATYRRDQEAVVYKMHGDVSDPNNAVLTRTDYETYDTERILFKEALEGQVVTRTFLFIGFSFSDPNLERMLARIRHTLKESSRTHYCIMKSVDENVEDYEYQKVKQELQIKDLENYHIKTIMVDKYDEITGLLSEIKQKTLMNSILISGSSTEDYGDFSPEEANKFISLLTQKLLENKYKVVNGFGLGVGHAVVNGALDYRDTLNLKGVGDRLDLRPFPFQNPEKFTEYRKEFISEVGIVISIFGNNKNDKGKTIIADGVVEEADIAAEMGKILLPISLTGFAAKKIHDKYYQKNFCIDFSFVFDEEENKIEKLVDSIIKEINKLKG